jgi:NADPH:quinone reductase-like Zn-dependent oxidoreductase
MRAATFTSTTGGLEKNIRLNPNASLPPNASSLPADSTLVKVAYASPNPVDYKLPENALFRRFLLPKAKDGSAIPCGDFAGKVLATTLKDSGLSVGDRVFGRSDPPHPGTCGEYAIVKGRENVVAVPEGVSLRDASTVGVAGLTAWQCIEP